MRPNHKDRLFSHALRADLLFRWHVAAPLALLSGPFLILARLAVWLVFKSFAASFRNLIPSNTVTQSLYSKFILLSSWSMLLQHIVLSSSLSHNSELLGSCQFIVNSDAAFFSHSLSTLNILCLKFKVALLVKKLTGKSVWGPPP